LTLITSSISLTSNPPGCQSHS